MELFDELRQEMYEEMKQEAHEEEMKRTDFDYFVKHVISDELAEIEELIAIAKKKADKYGWELTTREIWDLV